MAVVLTCACYIAMVTVFSPLFLTRGTWQIWYPRTALIGWYVSMLSCVLVFLLGVLTAVVLLNKFNADSNAAGVVFTASVWLGLLSVSAGAALLSGRSEPIIRENVAHRRELRRALLGANRRTAWYRGIQVWIVDTDDLVAYSFKAPEPIIVVSQTIQELLAPTELLALLEHERTHLAQRHHLALLLSRINARCLPRFAPAVRLEQATRLLVELIADDAARRKYGSATVAGALSTFAGAGAGQSVAARANRLLTAAR